ncbi:hypothetical protein PENTCL1PPCAC_14966, partial [Pristionchus entomophagus]
PAFILADAGFDVFLLNHRGSRFSKRHATLSTSYKTFWQFSLDELAKYDAPAVIDKVLQLSGQHGTYWIGHSQGTSVGYMMLAENPEYNKCILQVKGLFQLAPAGSSGYLKGPLTLLQWYYAAFKEILDVSVGHSECMTNFAFSLSASLRALVKLNIYCQLCAVAVQILAGPSAQPLNVVSFLIYEGISTSYFQTRLPVYLAQAIFATSTWNVAQWAQMGFHRRIEHMDHTPVENMRRYGQITPPPYNYSGITVPIYHFWSRNDLLTTPEDTERTILPILRKGAVKGSIEVPEYNHIDFALATDCAEKVFRPIEKIVRKQETQMCLR